MIEHIVLFEVIESTSSEKIEAMIQGLQSLKTEILIT